MYTAAVITISVKGFRGERVDTSGPNLVQILKDRGFDVTYTCIIPDDREMIREELVKCADELGIALVLTLCLIKPVLIDGNIIHYTMGNWQPVGGWAIGISLEVDALSLFFAIIVTVAVFVSGIYSFTYMAHDDSLVNFYTLFLMLSGSVLGLVVSGDLFNIFVMIEIMTFTAVALTAFRNDYEGALEGAFKYLVVGSLGSTSVLVGIAMIYSQLHTLNLAQIAAMLPSHMSREPAMVRIMAELSMEPILHADMALGEGTGAVALLPLLDMALRVYHGPHTFDDLGMAAYTPQEEQV
jgi:NADH:ubiquinone oxidoreductase subunit 4 (subunit M)